MGTINQGCGGFSGIGSVLVLKRDGGLKHIHVIHTHTITQACQHPHLSLGLFCLGFDFSSCRN